MMDEGGQVSGEDVEANPQAGWNPLGFCEDAERISTFHLKTIVITPDLWCFTFRNFVAKQQKIRVLDMRLLVLNSLSQS